jgi:hypothetical protein
MTEEAGLTPGTDASTPDLAELRSRLWKIEDRLFMFAEIPDQTPLTIDVMFDRLEELAAGLDRFAYVLDLSGSHRPDARTRDRLKQRLARLEPRLAHVGAVVGSNAVIRAVAKLVTFAVGLRSFTFYASIDEAVEACRRALR